MSCFEAKRHAFGGLPARRPTAGGVVRRCSIQTKASDHGEGVTASSIHRDPFSLSTTAVGAQFVRAQRGANEAGARQSVGNRARAIIAAVVKGAMAAAVSIRFRAQLIRCPDNPLHRERGICRRQRHSAVESRLVSRGGRSRRRKRTGKVGLGREDKNRGAKNRRSNRNSHEVSVSGCYAALSLKKRPTGIAQIFRAALEPRLLDAFV